MEPIGNAEGQRRAIPPSRHHVGRILTFPLHNPSLTAKFSPTDERPSHEPSQHPHGHWHFERARNQDPGRERGNERKVPPRPPTEIQPVAGAYGPATAAPRPEA